MAHATVSRCLRGAAISRAAAAAREQVRRFEWPCPGDLLQMDTKRLARFSRPGHKLTGDRSAPAPRNARGSAGSSATRSSTTTPGWSTPSCIADETRRDCHRLRRARPGVLRRPRHQPRRLQTDNAWTYIHNRALRDLLAEHGIQHRRIPPRTPKRNGKVERYQQTLAREWAYGQRYRSSTARAAALPIWLIHYNTTRPHSAIGNRPPISRIPVRKDRGRTARRCGGAARARASRG